MKTKKAFLAVTITALILTIILVSLKAYYVAVALILGTLVIGYREFWCLLTKKKMPPLDERIRENVSKSVRNGFIFFAIASVFLMLFFSIKVTANPDIVHILSGLFLSAGLVYLLSYMFYNLAEPRLTERSLTMLKTFLTVAGISAGAFIISVFLHNFISGLFKIEEPVFFCIAVFVTPLTLGVGLIGSLVIFIKGLFSKTL